MSDERKDAGTRAGSNGEHAEPQDGSLKTHGDVLDPVIPRGADQKAADSPRVSEEGREGRETPPR